MEQQSSDNAGVTIPPPLVYAGAIIVGAVLTVLFPIDLLPTNVTWRAVGVLLAAIAISVAFSAFRQMKRSRTNPEPWLPTKMILNTGVYAFSRNPIYLGFTLFQAGVALIFGSVWILLLLIPVLIFMRYKVILREENYLERKFGEQYLAYKRRVRRWL